VHFILLYNNHQQLTHISLKDEFTQTAEDDDDDDNGGSDEKITFKKYEQRHY
jgi:hypothetical protein